MTGASRAIVKERLNRYESRVRVHLPHQLRNARHFLSSLQRLPEHTIILYTAISQDAAGTHFIDETQSLPMVVGVANAPVFVMEDTFVGQGTVGGYVTNLPIKASCRRGRRQDSQRGKATGHTHCERRQRIYVRLAGTATLGIQRKRPPARQYRAEPATNCLGILQEILSLASFVCCFLETLLVFALFWQRAEKEERSRNHLLSG